MSSARGHARRMLREALINTGVLEKKPETFKLSLHQLKKVHDELEDEAKDIVRNAWLDNFMTTGVVVALRGLPGKSRKPKSKDES